MIAVMRPTKAGPRGSYWPLLGPYWPLLAPIGPYWSPCNAQAYALIAFASSASLLSYWVLVFVFVLLFVWCFASFASLGTVSRLKV